MQKSESGAGPCAIEAHANWIFPLFSSVEEFIDVENFPKESDMVSYIF